MPANLTHQYLKAEEAYKAATTPDEKLYCLEEMLKEIPKHKGTEKLQADIKRRISALKKGSDGGKSKGSRVDPFHIIPSGGGQIVLLGAPNTGKSSLVGALSRAKVVVSEQPFATQTPVAGMMHFEDAPMQLIDLPPITQEYVPPGMLGAVRNCDAVLLMCDLGAPDALEELELALAKCAEAKVILHPTGETLPDPEATPPGERHRPALILGTKCDLPDAADTREAVEELLESGLPLLPVSTTSGAGLDQLRQACFSMLRLIRVYSKEPGKKAELVDPFLLHQGCAVIDLATKIHKDVAAAFKFARVWGESAPHDGAQVSRDHVLADRDLVEVHA